MEDTSKTICRSLYWGSTKAWRTCLSSHEVACTLGNLCFFIFTGFLMNIWRQTFVGFKQTQIYCICSVEKNSTFNNWWCWYCDGFQSLDATFSVHNLCLDRLFTRYCFCMHPPICVGMNVLLRNAFKSWRLQLNLYATKTGSYCLYFKICVIFASCWLSMLSVSSVQTLFMTFMFKLQSKYD